MTYVDNQEEIQQANQKTKASNEEVKTSLDELISKFNKTGDTIKDNFVKSLEDAIKGGNTFSTTFDKIRSSLEKFAIETAVLNPLSNYLTGTRLPTLSDLGDVQSARDILPERGKGGLLGNLAYGLSDFLGFRAYGGPVGAGQPFIVGERGPELFVPQTAGSINPNVGGSPVHITMNISTPDAASFQASQTQIAASMMDAARRAQRIR